MIEDNVFTFNTNYRQISQPLNNVLIKSNRHQKQKHP